MERAAQDYEVTYTDLTRVDVYPDPTRTVTIYAEDAQHARAVADRVLNQVFEDGEFEVSGVQPGEVAGR